MWKATIMTMATALMLGGGHAEAQKMIQRNDIQLKSDLMTPEALWATLSLSSIKWAITVWSRIKGIKCCSPWRLTALIKRHSR